MNLSNVNILNDKFVKKIIYNYNIILSKYIIL